jgi:tRNA A-37 threonylcarbamoyl transferase component Bud32
MEATRFRLVARTGHPSFLDLPWDTPLEEWDSPRLVNVIRGISRHVVRFVEYDGALYALKELPERPARREWRLLRGLETQGLPVVEAVGMVTDREADLEAVLITRHLDYSLPYRTLFSGAAIPDLRTHLLNALAELLTRLHVRGFFWGDCSLSNALFRRDAGALSAYLVDAETGEQHPQLTDGQRGYDLDIAQLNVAGELLDIEAEMGLSPDLDPEETAAEIVRRYEALWCELTREETFGPDERFKVEERLRRLNALGFDVEEIQLNATPDGYRLNLDPHVVEPGHHRHRLLRLTGLDAQENQARRMLNDIARFREAMERVENRPISESVAASHWREEVFEPTVAAVPEDLWAALPAAELFHQVLEHRWFLSERAGKDVGIDKALESYVASELPMLRPERIVLEQPDDDAALEDVEPPGGSDL